MSKEKTIAKLFKVFRKYGYEGSTLSRLSEATGLVRSSLYHYFPKGKEEMAAATLEYANQWLNNSVLPPLQSRGKPIDRLKAMSNTINEFYHGGEETCLLAAFVHGEGSELFGSQMKQILNIWIEAIVGVLKETGIPEKYAQEKAENAIIQIQGALILAKGLEDRTAFVRIIDQLPQMLLH